MVLFFYIWVLGFLLKTIWCWIFFDLGDAFYIEVNLVLSIFFIWVLKSIWVRDLWQGWFLFFVLDALLYIFWRDYARNWRGAELRLWLMILEACHPLVLRCSILFLLCFAAHTIMLSFLLFISCSISGCFGKFSWTIILLIVQINFYIIYQGFQA